MYEYNLFRIVCPLDDGLEDQDEHEDEDECECEQAKGCVCDERKVCSGRKMLKLGQLLTRSVGNSQVNFKFSILGKAYATLPQVPLITAQLSS